MLRSSTEIYDSAGGTFSGVGANGTARFFHSSTLLADGRVLIMGGSDDFMTGDPIASVEIFDPALGFWASLPDLVSARSNHTASLLPDGSILIFGGDASSGGSVERYDPAVILGVAQSVEVASPIQGARDSHTATVLLDGTVLIAGGAGGGGTIHASAEIYSIDETGAGPVEEPVEEPEEEELPPLTFASLADTPLPDLAAYVTPIPAGLTLFSVSGLAAVYAAGLSEESLELSAAQNGATDISELPPIPIDWFLTYGLLNENVVAIIDPNDGNAFFSPSAPASINKITHIRPGYGYYIRTSGANALIDYYINLPHDVRPIPGARFTYIGITTPWAELDPDLGIFTTRDGTGVLSDLRDGATLFRPLRNGGFDSFRVGVPTAINSYRMLHYGQTAISTGTGPFVQPQPDLPFGACDTIVSRINGEDSILTGPGGDATVEIELIQLSLMSVAPVTVTTGGGEYDLEMTICFTGPE